MTVGNSSHARSMIHKPDINVDTLACYTIHQNNITFQIPFVYSYCGLRSSPIINCWFIYVCVCVSVVLHGLTVACLFQHIIWQSKLTENFWKNVYSDRLRGISIVGPLESSVWRSWIWYHPKLFLLICYFLVYADFLYSLGWLQWGFQVVSMLFEYQFEVYLKSGVGSVLPPRYARAPTASVKPAGWALDQAKVQANGLAGHLRDFDS